MENFQLYKTNVLLGGQMKWDLILDVNGDVLEVSDLHLTSISPSAPQIRYSDENLMNYRHQENVKEFYNKNLSNFYNECVDARLNHNWPVIDEIDTGVVVESSYDAGPKHSRYSLYNKSLEIFCPLWLEHVDDELEFNIIIETSDGESRKRIATKRVKLGDKFKEYLYEYFNHVGLLGGDNDVLHINFDRKIASISGISVESGNVEKIDISSITYNMLYRERPLMETDYMLIHEFPNHKLISKQLFNFCFHFNLQDILSSYFANMLYGENLMFRIESRIGNKVLEMRDFYSNYQYIPRKIVSEKSVSDIFKENESQSPNVLNYLGDWKNVDLINKNKYVQSTIHWSLLNNLDYIFNVYDGFGGILNTGTSNIASMSHNYGSTPDTTNDIYNEYINNIGWCSIYTITTDEWYHLMNDDNKLQYEYLKSVTTDLKLNWVNDLNYKELDYEKISNFKDWNEFKCAIFICSDQDYFNIKNINASQWIDIDRNGVGCTYMKINDEFIGIFVKKTNSDTSNLNKITFKGFQNILDKMKLDEDNPLYFVRYKLSLMKPVSLISIDKSLHVTTAESPSLSTTEIEYFKNDSNLLDICYVLRYDGNIKPTFIKYEDRGKNVVYGKRIYNEFDYKKSEFAKYSNSGFSPSFPSIGYCAWVEMLNNYSKYNSPIKMLIPEIQIEMELNKNENINERIDSYLKQIYHIISDKELNNIKSKYNIRYEYDYKSEYDINNYIYKLSMILK